VSPDPPKRFRERFALSRLRLVAKDVAGRLAARLAPARAPRESLRRSMSRGTPPRGPRHRRLQEAYRARRIRRFLPPEVRAGELAFDVGANVGEWSAVMRRAGARVVAVEPQADCADAMRDHFAGDPGIEIVESAVGDWIGVGSLRPATTSSEHASMSSDWRETAIGRGYMQPDTWLDPVEVPVITLDALIEEHGVPSFCKVDEGFEPEALRGLSQPLRAIAFEFHRELPQAIEQCIERLAELGSYRYTLFAGEWPDRVGAEMEPGGVAVKIASLEPGTWGMLRARHV
jgi:FkbM family methyltransferase